MLLALLLTASSSYAIDGHGGSVIPDQDGAIDARYTWGGAVGGRGVWSAGLLGEVVDEPVTVAYDSGTGEITEYELLDELIGFSLRAEVDVSKRLGFGVVVPFWVTSSQWDATTGATSAYGPAFGDIRVRVPVGILLREGDEGLAIGAVAEVAAPTGPTENLLGGGLHLAGGYNTGILRIAGNLGVQAGSSQAFENVRQGLQLRGSALLGVEPWKFFGIAAELWAAPSLSDSFEADSSPAEVSVHASGRIAEHFVVTAGYGQAITNGAGAAASRITAGIGWQSRPKVDVVPVITEPVVAGPPTPYDLLITATDDKGKPMDADVHVEGDGGVTQDWTLGKDGKTRIPLGPGNWRVTLSKDGQETQSRRFSLGEGRWRPVTVEAVLLPKTGDKSVSVRVTDNEARAVENASVKVDGKERGTTSTEGELTVEGLAEGEHTVEVQQSDFSAPVSLKVAATETGNDTAFPDLPLAALTLERPPGSVKVVTRSNRGAVPDAVVRFLGTGEGQEDRANAPVGEDGEQTFQLAPGPWTAVVSAAAFGVQARDIQIEPGQTTLVSVDVVLTEQVGQAGLNVRVVDVDGNAVEGAEVRVDDVAIGSTGNLGTLSVGGLAERAAMLTVRGRGLRPSAPKTVQLVPGTRDVTLSVDYLPGTLQILARGPEGPVADAMVRFVGPDNQPATALGPDGRGQYALKSGDWQVILSSPAFGLQSRDVVVRPDETSLIFIDARLLASEKGDATMALEVTDTEGRPVAGAHVRLDGADVGTTSTGGDITLGTLQPGTRSITVTGDIFQDFASDAVELKAGTNTIPVKLAYKTTVIRLRAHTPDNAPVDALVRFYGAMGVDPARLGAAGERLFALTPGSWTVALSNEVVGVSQADFTVKESAVPVLVDLLVEPPKSVTTSLALTVLDPAGEPVQGALATLGASTEATALGTDGAAVLGDLQPGPYPLMVAAPGYTPVADAGFHLALGAQERTLRMVWLPRSLSVKVVDPKGRPVDAEVLIQAAEGKAKSASARAGADGVHDQALSPGLWKVIVVADGYGAQQRDVPLVAGEGPFEVVLTLTSAKVEVEAGQVTIAEQVHFPTNSAAISAGSFRILDEVASTLLVHPEIRAIEIQGHTDDVGGADYNLELSQRRADAVRRYLIDHGIDPARLVAKGFGASEPLAENTSEKGRSKNRRVQFVIVP